MASDSTSAPRDDERAAGARMPMLEHLRELRLRLIRALIALAVGFAAAYAFADPIFRLMTEPFLAAAGGKAMLIGTGVGEAFLTKIKVALIAGLFVASPAIFYEVWKFIAPGLYATEKRMAVPFIVATSACFVAGGVFCYAVVFPVGYAFFISEYVSIGVTPTIRVSEYLSFSARLILAFGLTFEMPVLTFFLTRLGVIDHHALIRHWRWIIVGIFGVAAALTPPDAVSMMLLAVPLTGLYGASVGVAYVFRIRATAKAAAVAGHSEAP